MYIVEVYDVADDTCRDGTWSEFARCADRTELAVALAQLYARAYGSPSIDVWHEGERLEESQWPEPLSEVG